MIKAVMMVIKKTITRGVTTLSLKGNLILRFTKQEGAQETRKDVLIMEKSGYWGSRKGGGPLGL
jgi:hypothetical protein